MYFAFFVLFLVVDVMYLIKWHFMKDICTFLFTVCLVLDLSLIHIFSMPNRSIPAAARITASYKPSRNVCRRVVTFPRSSIPVSYTHLFCFNKDAGMLQCPAGEISCNNMAATFTAPKSFSRMQQGMNIGILENVVLPEPKTPVIKSI